MLRGGPIVRLLGLEPLRSCARGSKPDALRVSQRLEAAEPLLALRRLEAAAQQLEHLVEDRHTVFVGDRLAAGFRLHEAVADALVVRMLLLPAVLQLLGRSTWSLPAWLERRLPRLAIEAEPSSKPPPSLEPALEPGS
jgi:hypothetical protein